MINVVKFGVARLLAPAVLGALPGLSTASLQVYASPNGNDSASGMSASTPVKTLGGAVQVVRQQRAGNPANPAVINLAGGRYQLTAPITLFAQDSNLTISGPASNTAIVTGGAQITAWSKFISAAIRRRLSPAAARAVYSALLPAGNLGAFARRGGSASGSPFQNLPAELMMDGNPMSLARFPTTGWARITSVGSDGVTATMNMSRRVASANDAWVQGYWSTEWWQTWEPATAAPNTSTIQVAGLSSGSPLGPVQVGARVAVVNALEDLNQPGQYYVDRPNRRVYFYPPHPIAGSLTEISQVDGYLIDASQTNNLTFKNLVIQGSRGQGVLLYACTNTGLDSCTVRSTQLDGVVMQAGSSNFVKNGNIHDTGGTGITSIEGVIATLTQGGDLITNNTIANPGRLENTYRPAIWLRGVAGTVSNNTLTNCPGQGIIVEGCNHLVTQNDISHIGTTMNDVGAIYTGQNLLNRGNLISSNIIHDSPPVIIPASGTPETVGVYLDDFSSGFTVQDNVFYNLGIGVLIGGGRSNIVTGNAFAGVTAPVLIDARGVVGETSFFASAGPYQQQLTAMSSAELALFSSTYPDFAAMINASNPALPEGNVVSNPYFPSPGNGVLYFDPQYTQALLSVLNPLYNGNLIFVNPAAGDFSLVPGAQVTTFLPTSAGSAGNAQSVNRI